MNEFRLDRSAFKAQSIKEAAVHSTHYKKLTWQERLRIADYLNSVAFDYDINCPPRMDRTKFSTRCLKK
jgi:hypothetical protein